MLARRLLMASGGGGSFPAPVGSGILTVGAISTILDDTYYNAWPSVCRMANDSLITLYTKGVQHAGSNNSNPDIKISANEGTSWGAEANIYDHASLKVAGMGITRLSSGRVIAALHRYDDDGGPTNGEAGIVYSENNGATWSGWVAAATAWTGDTYAAGPVVQLTGGDLLFPVEGRDSGDPAANRSSHTLRSTDNGATWGSEVTIRNYATDTRPYYETSLVLLASGELIAVHRCSAGTGTHYISRSSDLGATTGGWGTPYSAFAGYGKPYTIQADTGTLIAVTRRNSDAAAVAYTSIDAGVTWGSAYVLDATMTEMEYGCPVQLNDGRVLVVYGSQPTGSTTNSDIKQVYVTETLA